MEEKSSLSIYVSKCSNPACINNKKRLKPVSYLNQIIPYSVYGVDVYGLIGELRLKGRHTIPEIHEHIRKEYEHIEIGERHVENIVKHLELCLEQSGKNANELSEYFRKLNQDYLILTVDGLEPEKGHSILYIVREVTTGKILLAYYATYQDAINLKKEILLPLKAVIEAANLKVGGWQADKELAMGKAIQEVFKGVPFQHCQSHFLAAMKKPLTEADTALGKEVKKNFGKLLPVERKIDQGVEKGKISENNEECLQILCRSIRSWLSISLSDKHRLKGIELYESLNLIQQNISKMRAYKDDEILQELENKLLNSTQGLQTEYGALKQGQIILRELTDLLYGQKDEKGNRFTQVHKEQSDSQSVKEQVETLLNNSHEQFKTHSSEMRAYLKHFKDTHQRWATNLYTCYDFPKIPNDNNRLELSHSQMKKQYRRITGKSSTAQYLRNHGEQAPYLLAYARSNNSQQELEILIRNIDNEQLQKQKKRQLTKSNNRGKAMATTKKLIKTLKYTVQQWKDDA